jgi:hemerythrin superfamily protein
MMAKKAAKRKRTTRAAKKAKAAKRSPAKRKPTKAAKQKTAAGATVMAAIANRLPWAKNEDDPIVLLETDHRRFEKLLEEGEKSTERATKGRAELLDTITRELTVHEAIEEQLLYPALKPHVESRDIVLEGFEEHHIADVIIKELQGVATDDEKWGAKFKVLKETITHHIREEERAMFPTARGVLPRQEFLALGARMRALKAELER